MTTAEDRIITTSARTITVAYPVAWDKAFAWRHLLAHPPAGVRQPRGRSHCQLWTKAHTADAWTWTASVAGGTP